MKFCWNCGKPQSLKHVDEAEYRRRKIANVKATLAKRAANGTPIGRPKTWDDARIIELHKQGKSMSAIVGVVKCSKATVARAIAKYKRKPPPGREEGKDE